MAGKIKIGQIWKSRKTKDRVKVIKLLGDRTKLFDMDGSNYGRQFEEENHILIIQYQLITDVD